MPLQRLYSREELVRLMWRHRCIHVKDLETASEWRSVDGQHHFTVPEIIKEDGRWVAAEDVWDVEADLDAAGLRR